VNTIDSPTYLLAKFVPGILSPFIGNTNSFIKDSKHFADLIKDGKCDPNDLMTTFDVVSLFTKIPLNEAIEMVKSVTDPQNAKLVEICFGSTFFRFQGEFFEQTTGVAMGSPLSPMFTNLFM